MGEMNLVPPTGLSDRISPEYLAIQKELHCRPDYGIVGASYAEKIRELIDQRGFKSVLDYGCGKGTLKTAIGDIVREYDPCIPGKDAEPERAELLVCTDVLEHIEPEKLTNVLEHIRQLGDWVFLAIATRPATKSLSDGRNAHLIVRDEAWWKERLSATFDIKEWNTGPLGVCVIAKPYVLIGEIKGAGVLSYDQRLELVKQNVKITKSRLQPRKFIYHITERDGEIPLFGVRVGFDEKGRAKWAIPKPHDRVALVMCYGPSLQDTWENAVVEKEVIKNADIVSVSGAHDFLIEKGLIPKYHIECDPREHKGGMIARKHPKVQYLMASVCHPNVVKKVAGENLTLWHMNEGEQSLQILDIEPNSLLIPGGGSVGLRAIPLLYVKGYRRFIIHGMDCSFRGDDTHAGRHTGKKVDRIEIRCADGKKFITAPVLITYKRSFAELVQPHVGDADKIEIILRGDGLLQHWLRTSGTATPYKQEDAA
jgi:hypothetical protein